MAAWIKEETQGNRGLSGVDKRRLRECGAEKGLGGEAGITLVLISLHLRCLAGLIFWGKTVLIEDSMVRTVNMQVII